MIRIYKTFSLFILMVLCMACETKSSFIAPNNPNLVYEGRVIVDDTAAQFIYPGTAVRTEFSGKSIYARLKCNAGYYNVQIDFLPPVKVSTFVSDSTLQDSLFLLADGLSEQKHSIELTLVNEGLFSMPLFKGFQLDTLNESVSAPAPKQHTIEFIGNSITCGYGVEAHSKYEHFADSTENYAWTYAYITSHRFNAEAMVVARSGIGIYRNCGDSTKGSEVTMPDFYENVFITDTAKWDFSRFTPEIVCINLGTNDFSMGKYDMDRFQKRAISFVSVVRSKYPKANIILLSSGMLSGRRHSDCVKALNYVALHFHSMGDMNIRRFDFSMQTPELGYGADWHPSRKHQLKMANELTNYIESVSDWKIVSK